MSFCESGTCPRGLDQSKCPDGKAGEVTKIINQWKNGGLDIWFAGEEWKNRKAEISTSEEQDLDYFVALKKKTISVCEAIEKR